MQLYSTNDKTNIVDLKEALFKSLPADKGLYMPSEITPLPYSFLSRLSDYNFQEIAISVCQMLFQGSIPRADVEQIVKKSITFPAPVKSLTKDLHILELFHGPSLAFKDFGARFMAQLMSYFLQEDNRKLTILVATSGDTGGAVASGFYKTPGIEVIILYPSGKVSHLQEKQLTTLGENIQAVEVDGTFDDCQALVKRAFLDDQLNEVYNLSSANSINIARLIPQSFYYFEAFKQIHQKYKPTVFVVPSGNFGNLTAGLLAKKLGLKIDRLVAATNLNDVVPQYLESGEFKPRMSQTTISNAMDVGNPSNFSRMMDLYSSTWNNVRNDIIGYKCDEDDTRRVIREVYQQYDYTLCPHTAVGVYAAERFQQDFYTANKVVLATAHPSKFIDVVEKEINTKVHIPQRLAELADREKHSTPMSDQFQYFKDWLLKRR
ncbi:MAG: threonine synthase [Bacteroidota bacterium]